MSLTYVTVDRICSETCLTFTVTLTGVVSTAIIAPMSVADAESIVGYCVWSTTITFIGSRSIAMTVTFAVAGAVVGLAVSSTPVSITDTVAV